MKYKNIYSAIHNLGHSFTSLMNNVDGYYVIDELVGMHNKGLDIEIDWLSRKFEPQQFASHRINESIGYWAGSLEKRLSSQNVELEKLTVLKFVWPAKQRKYMTAVDDRGKDYKIYVDEPR